MKSLGFLLLAVVNLIHCQDDWIVASFQAVMGKLEGLSDRLKDMQQKLGNLETSFQNVHQKLENHVTNFEELHHELEHVKGAAVNNQDSLQKIHLELDHLKGYSQESGKCLRGDDLDHLTNVSAAAHQEIKSFVHEEISGLISLAQKDECSEESLQCGSRGICHDSLFSFTCSCPPGFTWNGSECADIDECSEGRGVCHPNATCKKIDGSYRCSCNKHFEGDGITSCELQCRSPAKVLRGLGCVKVVEEEKTFSQMDDFCREEGGRLLQHFHIHHLDDIQNSFGSFYGGWMGVYDEKWPSDESLVPEDLWWEGSRSDPSRRCGVLQWNYSSSSYKLSQRDCSFMRWGWCQFQLP